MRQENSGAKKCEECDCYLNSLAVANMLPRINRAKADALLKGAIDRAAIINSQPENLNWLTEVWVFGSHLTDTDDLGALDLVVETRRRDGLPSDADSKFCALHGRELLSHRQELHFPHDFILCYEFHEASCSCVNNAPPQSPGSQFLSFFPRCNDKDARNIAARN